MKVEKQNEPKIRFKIFLSNWDYRQLKHDLIRNNKKNRDLLIDNVESISNKTGFTKQTEQFQDYSVASLDLSNYYVINEGQFAYNPSRINVGSIAYKNKDSITSVVSPLYVSFSTKERIEDQFLWYWFKNQEFERQRRILSEGGVRDTLSFNQLTEMYLSSPSIKEQEQIGSFFSNLDHLITLHQRKLEQLSTTKKTFLNKMFTNKNEVTPEYRFDGFVEYWEQRKFKEIVTFYSGLTYKPIDVIDSPGTFVLRSSNVKDGEIVNADNVYVDSNIVNSDNVSEGDIIIVVRNGSRNLIGKHAQIKTKMNNTVIGAFMTGIRSLDFNSSAFVNSLLDTSQFYKQIHENLGATINQITIGDFNRMIFITPKEFSEKEKIGSLFKELDNLITLHQRKLDKLEEMKKYFLKNMFV